MANTSDDIDTGDRQRSYDRNLGYARFWLGASLAVFSLMVTFGYELVFGDGGSAASPKPAGPDLTGPELLTLLGLLLFAVACLCSSALFWFLYRRDNAALAAAARRNRQEAAL